HDADSGEGVYGALQTNVSKKWSKVDYRRFFLKRIGDFLDKTAVVRPVNAVARERIAALKLKILGSTPSLYAFLKQTINHNKNEEILTPSGFRFLVLSSCLSLEFHSPAFLIS